MRGHSHRRQRATSASSRSRARHCGFWQLHPIDSRMRHTWLGWYLTPQRHSITSATRASVHSSVRKPWRRGPRANARSNCRRRGALSLGGLPGTGLAASAFTPPRRTASRQRPTDTSDTRNTRATAAGFTPRWSIATASRRRRSNSAEVPFGLIEPPLPNGDSLPRPEAVQLHYFFKEQ